MSAVRIIPTEKGRLSDLFYRQQPMVSRESATISHAFCKKKPNDPIRAMHCQQSSP